MRCGASAACDAPVATLACPRTTKCCVTGCVTRVCAPPRAGGAWQCQFEKQVVGSNESIYVLVLQLPLRGVLKSGGLVFVLKATANQADKW